MKLLENSECFSWLLGQNKLVEIYCVVITNLQIPFLCPRKSAFFLSLIIFVFSPALFSFFQVSLRVYNPSSKQDWMMAATHGVRLTGLGSKN